MKASVAERLRKLSRDCAALRKSQQKISPLLLEEMQKTAEDASVELDRLRGEEMRIARFQKEMRDAIRHGPGSS